MDSDGDRLGFETLMSQLIEFLMTLVGNKRFVDLMRQAVPRLIYITLGASARHAPDAEHFLSEWQTGSVARLNCYMPALCTKGLLTALCQSEAVTASCARVSLVHLVEDHTRRSSLQAPCSNSRL